MLKLDSLSFDIAEARNRTEMVLLPLDFESSASTSFATSALKAG
jgi:hypothetical protein